MRFWFRGGPPNVVLWALFIAGAFAVHNLSAMLNAGIVIYWILLAILSRIRRWKSAKTQCLQILLESGILGFWIAWLNSEFISAGFPRNAWAIRSGASVTFGMQAMFHGLCLWGIRQLSWGRGVALMTLGATLAEMAQMRWGVAWPVLSVVMEFTDTPIIQWLPILGTFGLSTVLHLAFVLWLVVQPDVCWKSMAGFGSSLLVMGFLCAGGWLIESLLNVSSPPLRVVLVQPGVVMNTPADVTNAQIVLDQLTMRGLAQGPVDLIVWPEGILPPSTIPSGTVSTHLPDDERQGALGEVLKKFQLIYRSPGLVGVPLSRTRTVSRHGLQVEERLLYNSAVLIHPDGGLQIHEKLSLVPVKEGLPDWADHTWVRRIVHSWFGASARFSRGDSFRPLDTSDESGRIVRVAVCICYESLHPQLPQYDVDNGADALIHLLYDTPFRAYPEWIEWHLRACRARSIQTRRWSYVCSTDSGSCLIDPRGRVAVRIAAGKGVLRTDSFIPLGQTPIGE